MAASVEYGDAQRFEILSAAKEKLFSIRELTHLRSNLIIPFSFDFACVGDVQHRFRVAARLFAALQNEVDGVAAVGDGTQVLLAPAFG